VTVAAVRWVRVIIGLPILAILISFALSNRVSVAIGLWPTDISIELPLSLAVLIVAGFAFVLGGLVVWLTEFPQRGRARRAEHAVRLLEDEVKALKARLPKDGVLPPPP